MAIVLALGLFYQFFEGRKPIGEDIESIINSYLNIFVAFALVEERYQKGLPACEGILLIKENTSNDAININNQ
jgi:hypothetical protein